MSVAHSARNCSITLQIPTSLPRLVTASAANCYFRGEGESATLKVPIYEEELKYFYSNYKDYYYLPTEDVALTQICSRFRGQRAQAPSLRSELLHPEILLLSSPMGDSVHAILQERL